MITSPEVSTPWEKYLNYQKLDEPLVVILFRIRFMYNFDIKFILSGTMDVFSKSMIRFIFFKIR